MRGELRIRESQKRDRLNKRVRTGSGVMRIVRPKLIKSDIARNAHPTSNRVITTITLVLGIVAKENIINSLSRQVRALTGWKNIADATKSTNVTVLRRPTVEMLNRRGTLKSSGGL